MLKTIAKIPRSDALVMVVTVAIVFATSNLADHISGQLFFGTMPHFLELFDYKNDPETVHIDFSKLVEQVSPTTSLDQDSEKHFR